MMALVNLTACAAGWAASQAALLRLHTAGWHSLVAGFLCVHMPPAKLQEDSGKGRVGGVRACAVAWQRQLPAVNCAAGSPPSCTAPPAPRRSPPLLAGAASSSPACVHKAGQVGRTGRGKSGRRSFSRATALTVFPQAQRRWLLRVLVGRAPSPAPQPPGRSLQDPRMEISPMESLGTPSSHTLRAAHRGN